MTPELLGRLAPFREAALRAGIPPEDVERWISTACPTATLVTGGDGPVAGRFGGPLMLPPDAPDPWYPLLASLDCAALPDSVTGLQTPPDGHLLLFGFPNDGYTRGNGGGEVRYIPAGTPVEERRVNYACVFDEGAGGDAGEDLELLRQFPQDELRVSADVCLPSHCVVMSAGPLYQTAPIPGHPLALDLAEVWDATRHAVMADGPLHIGGYAFHECTETDPVVDAALEALEVRRNLVEAGKTVDDEELPAPEHWTLLAQWDVGLRGREGFTQHWVIPKQDLARRRFDRVHSSGFWNP
ncbi:DUF1963 domain-containing protein [Streptomyces sp. NPDC008313]|uniref:DUF1963 domain-containing protein n=1 Tax=Streptomyces sp. NPDC008313 TaxID=3364826 RepID=UPI0036E4C566